MPSHAVGLCGMISLRQKFAPRERKDLPAPGDDPRMSASDEIYSKPARRKASK
jgi:hypothetical protein